MPALYLGHGAPPLLDDALWVSQLQAWSGALPRPAGILIVSAHWEQAPVALGSAAAGTPLVYDFWGFEDRFYRMTYPTPDATALAARSLPRCRHGAPAPQRRPRPGPRRLGATEGDVPGGRRPGPADEPPRPGPGRLLDLGRRLRPCATRAS